MLEEMMTFYTHFRAQFHETRFLFISGEDHRTIIKEAKKTSCSARRNKCDYSNT